MRGRLVRIWVAMGGEDLFGGLEERVRGEPVALGQGGEDGLGEGDDFVEELDVCGSRLLA